ncbi:TrkH family potassium uptake protein [Desulfosporosinus sp. BICA1-9]|uniref:TrkH family potassium uptake protein n=1 Tax=Desulfosporosinus sp. BICA1-9 TaxID=1531958 RepID=UPI00054B6F04|nr:TrkH family potassium uptake protein [Desulfosporosinus sp. BICA1-9]KJS48869.1 MAG: membrane protein [Peptococcaceae bacterium BRH_c23]KJS85781.1 MAG: membrane protein [Desulfosporosinus sp. BICA1-9]HBW34277.1 TrkH family potassium uptake protein [Desulfosporosinus sp.]
MNYSLVEDILGRLMVAYAAFMGAPLLVSLIWQEKSMLAFLISIVVTLILGISLVAHGQKDGRMGLREGFVIVASAWLLTGITGALPYALSGAVPTYLDGLFETVSGLTTTGASVIDNVEILPKSILLWRSMTQWLGGMGIIVLFIVFLPNMTGTVHLFNAEVPGPISERVLPRIRDNALKLWQIYLGFTVLQIILLILVGMTWFDAINHSFTTMATGGFSTKGASIMYYDNWGIELIIIIFMIIAGGNFGLYYLAWRSGVKKILKDVEFQFYLLIIAVSTLTITLSLWWTMGTGVSNSLRQALFQVASIMTTTGYASADFNQWPSVSKFILLCLMFIGGSAGSTAGGIKVSRIILLFKLGWAELKRAIHPKAVINVRFAKRSVDPLVLNTVAVFFFLFLSIFAFATLLITATGLEPFDAMSAVAATLGNVGPGFGVVGPMTTFSSINAFGESVLILCMLLGRLELFTLLVLIQPEFWRSRKGW